MLASGRSVICLRRRFRFLDLGKIEEVRSPLVGKVLQTDGATAAGRPARSPRTSSVSPFSNASVESSLRVSAFTSAAINE